jgi:hypothetical protein
MVTFTNHLEKIPGWNGLSCRIQPIPTTIGMSVFLSIRKKVYGDIQRKERQRDQVAKEWLDHFNNLGHHLEVQIA